MKAEGKAGDYDPASLMQGFKESYHLVYWGYMLPKAFVLEILRLKVRFLDMLANEYV